MKWFAASLAIAACVWNAAPVIADDCEAPCFGYDISSATGFDWILASRPGALRATDTYPTLDGTYWFAPVEHFKLVTSITAEPVIEWQPGKSRFYDDVGIYGEELYAELDFEPGSVRAGKFDTTISEASAVLTGIHATDLADNFDTDERWGGELAMTFEALGLENQVTLNAFTTDRTVLSQSLFNDRGRARLSNGGAGNTSGVSSFSAVLDGCLGAAAADCYADGRYGYRLAARFQRQGQRSAEQIDRGLAAHPETALLAAVTRRIGDDDKAFLLLAEGGYLRHFEGGANDAFAATLSAGWKTGSLLYEATYTLQRDMIADGADVSEHLVDLTASYELGDNVSLAGEDWTIAAGYSIARNGEGENAHTISLEVTAELDGTIGGAAKEKD